MARRGTRKNRQSGLFGRLWSPFNHLLMAGEESVGAVTNTAKGVIREGARGVGKIGRSVTGHVNAAVTDLIRKRRNTRRNRRNTRKNTRRNNRK